WPAGGESAAAALRGYRRALFEETKEYIDTPIYLRDALRAGNVIHGPAIVEQLDATTVILPRQRAVVDRYGSLVITVEV
ncbi:MAG TPA: hydantoinase/oxoprolinase family protein, partial [Chloroflexota bacterium]|nr:hydantoinase/oxoprolinase family protein [Chloroflexota bacterium]